MRARVLRPFRYSLDGFNAIHLVPGDELEIRDDMADGLVSEGFVERPEMPPLTLDEGLEPARPEPPRRRARA